VNRENIERQLADELEGCMQPYRAWRATGFCRRQAAPDQFLLFGGTFSEPGAGLKPITFTTVIPNSGEPTRECPGVPPQDVYDENTNPGGIRCTLNDYMRNIFGVHENGPDTGKARRPISNIGVQDAGVAERCVAANGQDAPLTLCDVTVDATIFSSPRIEAGGGDQAPVNGVGPAKVGFTDDRLACETMPIEQFVYAGKTSRRCSRPNSKRP
jgi:hypothetical protein